MKAAVGPTNQMKPKEEAVIPTRLLYKRLHGRKNKSSAKTLTLYARRGREKDNEDRGRAVLGGNINPSATDIKHILESVGAEAEDLMIDLLLKEASGKDITELITSGRDKLASVTTAGAISVTVGGGAPSDSPAAAAEETKEEKVEVEEEKEEDMIFSLFE